MRENKTCNLYLHISSEGRGLAGHPPRALAGQAVVVGALVEARRGVHTQNGVG